MTKEQLARELASLLAQSDSAVFAGTCVSVAAHVARLSGCSRAAWESATQAAFDTSIDAAARIEVSVDTN